MRSEARDTVKVASEYEFNMTCHPSPKGTYLLTSQNLRRCVAGVSVFRSIVSMRGLAAGTLAFALSVSAFAKDPDCTGQRQPPVTLAGDVPDQGSGPASKVTAPG
jgi:hypothetical protein